MEDLPPIAADSIVEPLAAAYTALVSCLERRIEVGPPSLYYETLHGLLLMSGQGMGAAIILVQNDAGDRVYPVQSEIIARSILEGLGVILAIREAPEPRSRLFALDLLRHHRRDIGEMTFALAGERWVRWAHGEWNGLQQMARQLQVTPEEWSGRSWPSAGQLLKPEQKGGASFVTGSAAEVWELLYFVWYGGWSTAVHQKGRALIQAERRHRLKGEARQRLRDNAVIGATLAHGCALVEISAAQPATLLPVAELRAAWAALRRLADVGERVYQMRYGALLDALS